MTSTGWLPVTPWINMFLLRNSRSVVFLLHCMPFCMSFVDTSLVVTLPTWRASDWLYICAMLSRSIFGCWPLEIKSQVQSNQTNSLYWRGKRLGWLTRIPRTSNVVWLLFGSDWNNSVFCFSAGTHLFREKKPHGQKAHGSQLNKAKNIFKWPLFQITVHIDIFPRETELTLTLLNIQIWVTATFGFVNTENVNDAELKSTYIHLSCLFSLQTTCSSQLNFDCSFFLFQAQSHCSGDTGNTLSYKSGIQSILSSVCVYVCVCVCVRACICVQTA